MSRRHSPVLTALSEPEVRAHVRAERQRVRASLERLAGFDADDDRWPDEPGIAYRAPRHHDPERVRTHGRDASRHWKQPFWKRRTSVRQSRLRSELELRAG